MAKATSQYLAVVAIDFGTTFSGFAFSINDGRAEGDILMNKTWRSAQGNESLKTQTCLLLNPEQGFDSFGFDASEKYASFDEKRAQEYYFFDLFKMSLFKEGEEKTITEDATIKARNGKQLPAMDVFTHALRFLKDKALSVMREKTSVDFTIDDIQWVLTVPAIWQHSARQFMRDAAYEAELLSPTKSDQLIVALEPEAASLWCRQRKLLEFADENGEALVKDVIARNGTSYLVVDCGGGTVDITAHRIQSDDSIHEIYKATGGAWGGSKVDQELEMKLKRIFGVRCIDSFKNSYPSDWLDLIRDFEMKKRSDRAIEDEDTRLMMPRSFEGFCMKTNDTNCIENLINDSYPAGEVTVNRGYLCLNGSIVKTMFNPAVTSIVNHIGDLLQKPELEDVKYFFLVGGFSGSAILQKAIRDMFRDDYRILVPAEPEMAIVKGAVMYGKNPSVIQSRISARTYGVDINSNFKEGVHPESKKFHTSTGIAKCRDIFEILVKANEVVIAGDSKTFTFHPVEPDQTSVTFDFYITKAMNPTFVDDEGVVREGSRITVKSPDITKGTDRKIELKIRFGGTEIKATAIDVESSSHMTCYISLMAKDKT